MRGGTNFALFLLFGLIFLAAYAATGATNLSTNATHNGPVVTITGPADINSQSNLQLKTFGYITATPIPTAIPTPQTTCPRDSIKKPTCNCLPDEQLTIVCDPAPPPASPCGPGGHLAPLYELNNKEICHYWPLTKDNQAEVDYKRKNDPTCKDACIGKPVIYLYPTKDTLVDVKLTIPGSVVESDPLYPAGGWKNVLSHPSGQFEYQGKTYQELYYESSVTKVNQPRSGVVIATRNLKSELGDITAKLGLKPNEQQEFVDYWLPRLNDLQTPYILFSVLDTVEKDRVDHVDISPKPDTFIDFIAYFKPLSVPYANVSPLVLPTQPPERQGFTAVEWGGTIDY